LRQLGKDIRNLDEAEARKTAQDYLAKKGPPPNKTPKEIADEYDSLSQLLKRFASGFQKQREGGQLLFTGNPTDKQRGRTLFVESRAVINAAYEELGQDRVLYKELLVPLDKPLDSQRIPVMQSLVPDQRGISATVFLDGNVVFSGSTATNP
jgi:hypothetical protein